MFSRTAPAFRASPYSVATDGSNDRNSDCSLYPFVVRYFNAEIGKIVTMLLALGTYTEGSTGENIFKVMDNELKKRAIPWENCIEFCSYNASVVMGVHKGVVAHVIKKCPNVAVIGCPCHLIHLAAPRAASQRPVDIEDLLVDIYYYLEKRSLVVSRYMSGPVIGTVDCT